ncbi:transforming growth factor-beta receptor-associated protein 1 [Engraulis encrasicolus]|uniref:transforming growth factor-beta receptor-associated protein 1 n=1 Tax=Engraulis encrasicolus TaxID=184585 RepID=UPI002FCF3120
MSLRAFSPMLVAEKPLVGKSKDKDKAGIQCMEWCCRSLYLGGKDSVVHHLSLATTAAAAQVTDPATAPPDVREVNRRQMGRSGAVLQLTAIPVLNHLLVLWDGSVSALHMFSLEPVSPLKKIQNVSCMMVSDSVSSSEPVYVELVTASARRRCLSLHRVYVDRWECLRQLPLQQEPLAVAMRGPSICVATADRYLLHDFQSGTTLELFQHGLARQNLVVKTAEEREFLLNGPGSLGMLVMSDGTSQRAPVPWPAAVLDGAVCYPYVLALLGQAVHVYSMLDQQLKQTIPMQKATTLISTAEGVFVIAERELHCLRPCPLEEQIEALVEAQRMDQALLLLDGVRDRLPTHSYKELRRTISCLSGLMHFYQESFPEASQLLQEGHLDPRELLRLYPDMGTICGDFGSQLPPLSCSRDLEEMSREDQASYRHFLLFLADFLSSVRGVAQAQVCLADVDTALVRVYLQAGMSDRLLQLVSSANHCHLDICIQDLRQHKRSFALGLLYQSHGQHFNAIQTWVEVAEGRRDDDSCATDVYHHILGVLRRLEDTDRDTFWSYADWALTRDQEVGVQIFIPGPEEPVPPVPSEEIIAFLQKYPLALLTYLEYLVGELQSKEEAHHTLLALTYVAQLLLQKGSGETADGHTHTQTHTHTLTQSTDGNQHTHSEPYSLREKLQELLWQSDCCDVRAVHDKISNTNLHTERAILLGKAGEHRKALQILVHKAKDRQAAVDYCWRTSAGQERNCRHRLFLSLLQIYLDSAQSVVVATDLLNDQSAAFDAAAALQVVPVDWSVQLVGRFLREALREAFHRRRMKEVETGLAMAEQRRARDVWTKTRNTMVKLEKGTRCHACQRLLSRPEFVSMPTGELLHLHCSTAATVTVTGTRSLS